MKDTEFRVCVSCSTFNHSKYIEDAMEGFAMQRTDFPYVCIVSDDASTDGEPAVIQAYLERNFDLSGASFEETDDYRLIFARHKTNLNCHFAVFFLKYNHYSIKKPKRVYYNRFMDGVDYIAICEGDDYWTCPEKLQKQLTVMDAHPECTIAYNRVSTVTADKSPLDWTIPPKDRLTGKNIVKLEDLCQSEFARKGKWTFHTSSFFIRREMYWKYFELRKTLFRDFPYGDMPMELTCLMEGSGCLLQETMGCYRVLSGGYNSRMAANPEAAMRNELKLSEAFDRVARHLNGRCYKLLRRESLKHEYLYHRKMLWSTSERGRWRIFLPKHYRFYTFKDFFKFPIVFCIGGEKAHRIFTKISLDKNV